MVIPTMRTLKEAAQITGLSYDHLRKLCLQNKIVYVRAGSKFLINMEKLVEFLNAGEKVEDTHGCQEVKLWNENRRQSASRKS